jgi:glycosyltransferase involved in cell wall biosynthesis
MNEGYIIPVLEIVKYYLKTNYNAIAIDSDPGIKKFREKIIPIGPSFPLYIENMIRFMPRIVPGKNNNWTVKESKERINLMFRNPRLSYLKHLRKTETDLNIFFVMPYYPTHKILNEFRFEVMKALQNLVKTNVIIGFAPTQKLPENHQYLVQPVYEMRDYFRHLARSKVAIYVRGPHDGISSKLGQLLALGKPIIGQTIHNNKELYYQNQFFNEQFAYDDPEEIARRVRELLQDPEKAASFAEANANTFDTKFSPEISVSKIIEKLLD